MLDDHCDLDVDMLSISDPLTRDLLAWVARTPRSYAETMRAWRSSCPRGTPWEDALAADLIVVGGEGASTLSEAPVRLTPRDRAALAARNG